MTKTVNIQGTDYTVAPITVAAAKKADFSSKGIDFNIALIVASLNAAGDETATAASVEALPFFGGFNDLLEATMEVNGLKLQGETQPVGPALISTTSTAA